jgi:uncharacterized protein YndB with AHSA1/START domain
MKRFFAGVMMCVAVIHVVACGQPATPERAITETITVKANGADVWKAWTTTDGVKSFFSPDAKIDARVDGAFEVYMLPSAPIGMRGSDDMRFLALQEKKMLSFTWNAPPSLPEARKQRTVVIVRFVARGDLLTDVTLHHVGWGEGGEWDKAYDYFAKAWPNVLKNLKKRFDDGPIDWTPWLKRLNSAPAAPSAPPPATEQKPAAK